MAATIETFVVKMNIGGLAHQDTVRSANAQTAAKKAALKIKNTISKMECVAPSAKCYRTTDTHEILLAEFPDLRLLLR